jgi:hypothetical protein
MHSGLLKWVRRMLLGHPRLTSGLGHLVAPMERVVKVPLFDCHMCGQCVLHSTGMVCPMSCPKKLRNGPCGGVRLDGHCEVKPEMECVWNRAYHRSQRLWWPEEMHDLRQPVDWSLEGGSAWVNYFAGRDRISSGCEPEPRSALAVVQCHE